MRKIDYKKLMLSLVFDAVGMLSYVLPGIGELSDLVWAPVSFWLMTKMYAGTAGKIGGIISFIEEILPGTDFIPTFTIFWLYETFRGNERVP